jgi:YbgC/YbaW family acyl-CoA thioester hydrolase
MKQNIVERKIMWGDLDPLGIVFYPRYYEWMDACGHLFFESAHLTMGELWRDRKILFGLAETSCRYFKPGKYHQEIRIITSIDSLNEKTVVLKHTIRDSKDDTLLLEGFEKRICMDVSDPEDFRAMDIPQDIYNVLKEHSA